MAWSKERIAALQQMAQADESPNEQRTAQLKLAEAGIPPGPPRPPAPPSAGDAPEPFQWWDPGQRLYTSNGTTTVNTTVNWIFEHVFGSPGMERDE